MLLSILGFIVRYCTDPNYCKEKEESSNRNGLLHCKIYGFVDWENKLVCNWDEV
jgi:hypothetical protein